MRLEQTETLPVGHREGFDYITDPDNWHEFWPGFVRFTRRATWASPGDTILMVVRILGRERELEMRLERFEPYALVTYTSTQTGMPDARHERHFEADGEHLRYGLVVEYEPRGGLRGLLDRVLLPAAIRKAFRTTMRNLRRHLPAP